MSTVSADARTTRRRFVHTLRSIASWHQTRLSDNDWDPSDPEGRFLFRANYREMTGAQVAAVFVETQMADDDPDLAFLSGLEVRPAGTSQLSRRSLRAVSAFVSPAAEWRDGGPSAEKIRGLIRQIAEFEADE